MKKLKFLLLTFLVLSCDFKHNISKSSKVSIVHITGQTMGTYYSIKLLGKNVDKVLLKKQIDLKLKEVNQTFSTYIKNSEIDLINQLDNKSELKLSKQMLEVLTLARKIYQETEGAFDPTVGSVVNRWGFGPIKDQGRPSKDEINHLMQNVGMDQVVINQGLLSKKKSDLKLDLSAIAKGYGVDIVADFLRDEKDFLNVLVEIGGEIKAYGSKEDTNWAIGVERPSEQFGSGIQQVVPLLDKSVATSGSYRNYVKYGDDVFSHTIDPKTGFPVKHKLISVTVLDSKCVNADAMATALMVMGPEKGWKYANSKGLMAYFLVKTNSGIKEKATKAFQSYLEAFKR